MTITLPATGRTVQPSKLLCIGRNYAKHAEEMNSEVPDEPIVFLKPPSSLIGPGEAIVLPPQSADVHHEVELVAVIGRRGKDIAEADALGFVEGYAVGLDMTARDLQAEAKKKGTPWSVAKGFDTFAPLGPIRDAEAVGDPQDVTIRLAVNGIVRQSGHTGHMLFTVAALIAYCSRIFTLEPGDLLYTGTPEGVGPVQDGDQLEASVTGLESLKVSVRRD